MPRLTELVRVGFCQSYGDADYSIELSKVQDLPREKLDQLFLMMFHAQRQVWDFWWAKNQTQQCAAMQIPTEPNP